MSSYFVNSLNCYNHGASGANQNEQIGYTQAGGYYNYHYSPSNGQVQDYFSNHYGTPASATTCATARTGFTNNNNNADEEQKYQTDGSLNYTTSALSSKDDKPGLEPVSPLSPKMVEKQQQHQQQDDKQMKGDNMNVPIYPWMRRIHHCQGE